MDLQAALQRTDFAACGVLLQASRLPAQDAAQWRAWLQLHAGDAEGAAAAFAALGGGFDLHRAGCLFALHRHREVQELALQFPDLHALHAYQALCAYMSDDWERSQAEVAAYQREHPDSILAANIAACCAFRTGGPAAALQCLGGLPTQLPPCGGSLGGALVQHNAVVFADGAGGMQVLPPLVGVVPEARLNLALMYCRRGEASRALDLLRGLEPATALEHICKGVAAALQGQATASAALVREAAGCFSAVGSYPSEQDSVPGRQCLASAALLGPTPADALPLLDSIAEVCQGDDALSWNLGMARAAAGQWAEAAEAMQQVQSPQLLEDPAYVSWLVRCLARSGRPQDAWSVYVAAQQRSGPSPAVVELLHLLASDCWAEGAFLWAARAYHALEFMQQQGLAVASTAVGMVATGGTSGGRAWEGKRAAVAAAFREVAQGRAEAAGCVPELLSMLRGSAHPQAHAVAATIRQWASEHAPEALGGAAA
ncbi:tetratricopeptide repeat [Chlorella sorokiniana]|uniref:Tetratricopeptide repeat n=1 Tax=Chlorella sorokiniana TaxID=3076 RepID=A0A2P6TME2_CHLSO|nr:tetratricopeptide repeat [Chlorella sorokiniana]|eukprot:PRW45517.1 tetratricopeptide repeat [Chlorella sorokiniana]